jgi:hypothetical protein
MVYFVLGGLLVLVVAAGIGMLLQERRGATDPVVVYGVDDAVEFVWEGLSDDTRESISQSDVRRMLEWEMQYLQQPHLRDSEAVPVVGGIESARYVQEQAYEAGHSYDPGVIFEVLELQGAYLVAIGAVGEVAEGSMGEFES